MAVTVTVTYGLRPTGVIFLQICKELYIEELKIKKKHSSTFIVRIGTSNLPFLNLNKYCQQMILGLIGHFRNCDPHLLESVEIATE